MKTTLTILLATVLGGCSGGQQLPRDEKAEAAEELKQQEADFRPSDHDPDLPRARGHGIVLLPSDSAEAAGPSHGADEEEIQGFRVQIFSTTNIDAAKAKQAEAESYFPGEWFYMQYDPPAYKIRAGNFRQRFEADRFARLAVEKGFTDAWTVPEKVFKHPPRPTR
jgi:hypothetical protein